MVQISLWNIANRRMLEERGAMPREEGDLVRKYKAMREEDFHRLLAEGGQRRRYRSSGRDSKEDQRRRDKEWQKVRLREKWKRPAVARICLCLNFCSSLPGNLFEENAGRSEMT